MSAMQRTLLLGALVVIALSSLGGLVHGGMVGHETLLALREQYEAAFTAAARRDPVAAAAALEQAQAANRHYVRVIDAHTHFIKLAVVLVLAGLLLTVTGWSEARQRLAGGLLLGGAVLFPASLFLQTQVPGLVFRAGAAVGAAAVIAAMAMFVIALFRRTGGRGS